MLIPKELLAEKNYSGTRLIEITDPKILELRSKLTELQTKEIDPILEKCQPYFKILDPHYTAVTKIRDEIKALQLKITDLQAEVAPTATLYQAEQLKMDEIAQRAELIKNKLQPIINKKVASELTEFEKPLQVIEKGGKIYVEVQDELEEKIKQIRASKLKK